LWLLVRVAEMQIAVDAAIHTLLAAHVRLRSNTAGFRVRS
jgi:hypothetical protein